MLKPEEFLNYCNRHEYSEETRNLIERIRFGKPVRRANPGCTHSWGRYPSRKMRVTQEFESRTVEFPAILRHEYDDRTLEYYAQPWQLKCGFKDDKGRNRAYLHVPDLFVLGINGARFEEWKDEKRLITLAQNSPERYYRDNGKWHHAPAEAWARAHGLVYEVHSSCELNANEFRNARFLEDYL